MLLFTYRASSLMSSGTDTGPAPARDVPVCIPNVVLKSVLVPSNDRLHYCHVNAGSIPPKIDEFRSIFDGTRLDVVIASETWLKSYHADKLVGLCGFVAVRSDRHAKRSGGVIMYIREDLNYKVVKVSEKVSSEFLFVELIFPDSKVLVGAYYKAPRVGELDVLEDVLLELTVRYDDVLLLGDFNEDLLGAASGQCTFCVSHSCSRCEFADVIDRFGLKSIGQIASHYPVGQRPSLIDLCLTNRPEKVLFFNQMSHGLSRHDLLFGSYSCDKGPSIKPPRLSRNFARVDACALNFDAASMGWNDVFYATDVEEKIRLFNDKVLSLLGAHAPLRQVVPRASLSSTQPWFTDEIRRAILERDIAGLELRRNRVPRAHYVRLRNLATSLIKKAKHDYLQPKLHVNLGSKALWRNLREVGAVATNDVKPQFTADQYNAHLVKPGCSLGGGTGSVSGSRSGLSFSFSGVTSVDVARAMNSIKSRSIGLDEIPLTFVKMIMPFVLPSLTHIVNYAFTSCSVPRVWKLSKVLPVHKKTRLRGLDDFRPICILPCLSKVFEILAKEQVVAYLDVNRLLDRYQSGFRRRHSTNTALLCVSDEIRKSFERKCLTIMVLLDFSKAFDSLDHHRLLAKLSDKFGFVSSAVRLVASYLSDRFQCVSIGDYVSGPLLNRTGIPQGSVLGPLLFSMYINDLPACLKTVGHHLFADDVQLHHSFRRGSVNEAVFVVNQDLYAVSRWARSNFLTLNAKKSQAIVFSEQSDGILKPQFFPCVLLDGVVIPYLDSVVNLGLLMDKKLTFKGQVKRICSKVYSRLRSLWPSVCLFPRKTRLVLVKTLIVPAFTYGECVYSTNLSAADQRMLERAFSACVRFVHGLRRYDSTRGLVDTVLGCSLMTYLRQRRCTALHGIVRSGLPLYLFDKLVPGTSTRSGVFVLPRHSTRQYNCSFFVRTLSDYNSLPASVRSISATKRFSEACLAHLNA